ncbi:MAG: sel1 repeat family protein [Paludibacteraceae bacterium]|nr:sel1 repeat family protein [Paludibacteraceae bacterium]
METPNVSAKRVACWTRLCFEAETEAHDPGIVSRDACSGEADISELSLGMELSSIIQQEGWKYMRSYFPCVYLEEVRPDGITIRIKDNLIKVVPDQSKKVHEVGLSYAVGNIYIRLKDELFSGKMDSRWDVFTREEYDSISAAAEQGDAAAMNRLANIRYYGVPRLQIEADKAEANRLWKEAAVQGEPYALQSMAEMAIWDEDLPRDEREAGVRLLALANEGGNWDAAYLMGYLYQFGVEGLLEADMSKAIPFFARAAEAGHPRARCVMGMCYFDGEYVPEDKEKAAKIFKDVWNSSDTDTSMWASYALAQMYHHGCGIDESDSWAKILLRHAYEMGMEAARELFEDYFPNDSIYR